MSRPRVIGWCLLMVTLLAYLPILRDGFLNFDDKDYVTDNQMVQQGLGWPGIRWAFTTWHASNWHPVTWLSHIADFQLFRLNPAGHHLVNLLFHAANVWLLFYLWRQLTGAVWPGAMVAALFAWHPLHVESVAWVAERKDVLSTFFALLTLLAYVAAVRARKKNDGGQRQGDVASIHHPFGALYTLAVIFFALGLMSKPMVVTLPFVMLLLDYWPLGRAAAATWPRLVVEKWPFFLLTLASCVVTVLAQRAEAIAPLSKFSLSLRLENVVTAYAGYLYKMVWPAHLAVFYPLVKPGWAEVALAAGLLALISAVVCWRAASQPYLLAGWLWYLGTLAPVIGVLQVGDQAMADRYTYFPLIGIFFAVVWAAKDLAQQFRLGSAWLATAAALSLAGCLALTENQLRYWRNSETLFSHALASTSDNATARLNLGEAYQEEHQPGEALAEYRRALKLDPNQPEAYNNIGRLLNDQGRASEALEYCRIAVALDEKSAASHNGLGVVLAELGRFDEALNEFTTASRLNPASAGPHFQAGRVLLKMGRGAEAIPEFQEALRLDPGNLGMMIYIARVWASGQDPQDRNGPGALALAQRAAQMAGKPRPVVLDTLAMALAETGQFDAAAKLARQALDMAMAGGDQEDVTNIQRRLELYQKRQPARESY